MFSRSLGTSFETILSQYWFPIEPLQDSSDISIFDETVAFFLGS